MIEAIRRHLRHRRLRAEIRAKHRAFANEPLIVNIAAVIETASPELRAELVGYVAEGVEGAVEACGYCGPWGKEREALALRVCGELLGGAMRPDFVQQVMERLQQRASA